MLKKRLKKSKGAVQGLALVFALVYTQSMPQSRTSKTRRLYFLISGLFSPIFGPVGGRIGSGRLRLRRSCCGLLWLIAPSLATQPSPILNILAFWSFVRRSWLQIRYNSADIDYLTKSAVCYTEHNTTSGPEDQLGALQITLSRHLQDNPSRTPPRHLSHRLHLRGPSVMATMAMPPPSLDTMPEEILSQIVGPLLPLKWYSLSVLVSLSQTCSSLRTWLLEDESIWNKALLGRGMGRPLYTIPGYEGYAEWEKEIREAHRKIREKVALEKSFGDDLDDSDVQQGQQRKKPMMLAGTDVNANKAGPAPLPPSAVYHHGVDPNAMDYEDGHVSDVEDYAFPITCRDLCFRIYAHERKCLSCKVGDSKLSHYYLTDSDLRNADKVGVHPAILKFMGNNWGFGAFEPAHFDKVLNIREARTRAVSTFPPASL